MSFYLSMVQIIWYSHAFFFLKFRVSGTLLFVWPFLYFVLYSWSTANLKSSNVLWSMSWLIHNFVFPKKKKKAYFFLLTVHCFFLWTIHKIHCIVFSHVIHDNSFIFKSFQNKIFAGDFLLTSFTGFFLVQYADSLLQFLHFCTQMKQCLPQIWF